MELTKKQFEEFIANTKLYVDGKSAEIQKRLADLGIITRKVPVHTEAPFIYIDRNDGGKFRLRFSHWMDSFTECKNRRIYVDDILYAEIGEDAISKEEGLFKPFDKVLVRHGKGFSWAAAIFSHIGIDIHGNSKYVCNNCLWDECIPYNEQTARLIGTSMDYDGTVSVTRVK